MPETAEDIRPDDYVTDGKRLMYVVALDKARAWVEAEDHKGNTEMIEMSVSELAALRLVKRGENA